MDRTDTRKSFKHNGQLKVALKVTDGSLKVHISQAKCLSSRWRPTCNPYTQVLLVPDETKKSLCQTEVQFATNHPRFGETFTYELMPEDERKRLMISVWHQDTVKSEFLGCMSFGIRHLIGRTAQKEIEGWYYLLSENLGHRKHLVASMTPRPDSAKPHSQSSQPLSDSSRPLSDVTSSVMSCDVIPDVNAKVNNMEELSLVIHKNHTGYGFTIRGSCPVRVGRIKPGSTSALSGLRSGDYITRINGKNVSRSRAESVAEIVKKSEGVIVMDVHRPVKYPLGGYPLGGGGASVGSPLGVPPGCVMDYTGGEFLKPDGTEGETGVQDENLPPGTRPLPRPPLHTPHPASRGVLSPKHSNIYNLKAGNHGSSSSASSTSERDVLLSHQAELRSLMNETYESLREMRDEKTPAGGGSTSQTVPKAAADFSCTDSAYGSHGGQRSSGSSLGTSSSTTDSVSSAGSKERRTADHILLTTINELEEAVVQGPSPTEAEVSGPRQMYNKWDPSISIITRASSRRSLFYNTASTTSLQSGLQSGALYNTRQDAEDDFSLETLNNFCDESLVMNETLRTDAPGFGEGFGEGMCTMPLSVMSPLSGDTLTPHTPRTPRDSISCVSRLPLRSSTPELPNSTLDCLEESVVPERQEAVYRVLQCEEEYSRQMQIGIQHYSRPLRHCIISSRQHKQLFQNIEKLVALSEFHIRQLIERSYSAENTRRESLGHVSIEAVGQVYQPKIRMLCEAYRSYHAGLDTAVDTLQSLHDHPGFSRFTAAQTDFSLGEFLHTPVQHIADLHGNLVRVRDVTEPEHDDYSVLQSVITVLEESCSEILGLELMHEESFPVNPPCTPYTTLGYTTLGYTTPASSLPGATSGMTTPIHTPAMLTPATVTQAGGVDRQVRDLQDRLIFGKGVKPFNLTSSLRHLIFSGDLVYVRDDLCVTLTVTLLSDLLLLIVKEPGGKLRVMDDPILLADIVKSDFSRLHPSEFSLVVETPGVFTHARAKRRARHFLLRAPDLEHKCAWKSILEHRVRLCKPQDSVLPLQTELAF